MQIMNNEVDFADLVAERNLWMKKAQKDRASIIHQIATKMANRGTSDPFTYSRVRSHLTNNITTPQDYPVKIEATT